MIIGLIGAPNQGKSTFFNALTLGGAEVAPHPFTTIKPNEGVAYFKVKKLRSDERPVKGYTKGDYRFIPVRVIDVAGLVPGASEGRGLGNQFLNDLITADAFIIVVDSSGSTDMEGNPVINYDPTGNVTFILDELDKWFYSVVSSNWESVRKRPDAVKLLGEKLAGIGINAVHIKQALPLINDLSAFSKKLRELSKPFIVASNKCDKLSKPINGFKSVNTSAVIEFALRKADSDGFISYVPGEREFTVIKELSPEQDKALSYARSFLAKQSTGVCDCLNHVVIELLKCIVAYPVMDDNKWTDVKGNVLPDALLLPAGSTALDLAYKVHNDLGNGFIKAVDARTKKSLGREHVLSNGDVIKIFSKA